MKQTHVIKLDDGRNVIYEDDCGTNNGKGYALLYDDDFDGYERYEIGYFKGEEGVIIAPDFDRPLNYENGTNKITYGH